MINVIVTVETCGVSSFENVRQLVLAAKEWNCGVKAIILDRIVIAVPGDDPHFLYKGFGLGEEPGVPAGLTITSSNIRAFIK